MATEPPAVRAATPADLPAIARVHQAAFPGFFLTELGPAFLRAYYGLVLDYPRGILLVAEQDGAVSGFVAGFVDPAAFYRLMRSHRYRLGWILLPRLLRRPRLVAKVRQRMVRSGGADGSGGVARCELSSIGVERAGGGIGTRLVGAFFDSARSRGAKEVYLTTDACGNDPVNRFYQRLGFAVEKISEVSPGRKMNHYVIGLE